MEYMIEFDTVNDEKAKISYRAIGEALGVSKSCVANTMRRFKESGTAVDATQRGRPRKTSPRQDCALLSLAKANRTARSKELATNLMNIHNVNLFPKRKMLVQQTKTEKFLSACVFPAIQQGGEAIMIWGCITSEDPGEMRIVNGLCCECGTAIEPNPANMCVPCLRTQVDITEGIPKQAVLHFCKGCERYLQPPAEWVSCSLESRELLSLCLKKLKGLNRVKLVDAGFVWTEPHSKRIKV
ncbi:unnamed protein product, partial [Timema podura]|nr:unnamed protein product [Timema podura]